MKLMIASDIHGSAHFLRILLARHSEEEPQHLVLLGDLLYHGPRNDLPQGYAPKEVIPLLNALRDSIIAVRGNCEAEVDQMVLDFPVMADYAPILLENGRLLLATHGHIFGADNLPPLAQGGILVQGHTHVKMMERRGDTVLLNPGSVSIPKDGSHSYMMYEDGLFTMKELLTGQVLGTLAL